MDSTKIQNTRGMILNEWQRQTYDAFVLPLEELQMTEEEERTWIHNARSLSGRLEWDTYSTTRDSFLRLASDLLQFMGLSPDKADPVRTRMYVRFMEGRIRYFQYLEKHEKCSFPAIEVGTADFHNVELASVFAHMEENEEQKKFLEGSQIRWEYEQLHMVTWFSGQLSLGKGLYSRSRPNHSARVTYERLLNPYSLLWIATVLGENRDLIQEAYRAAYVKKDYRDKAIIIRNRIPYSRIYRLALLLVEKERNRIAECAV